MNVPFKNKTEQLLPLRVDFMIFQTPSKIQYHSKQPQHWHAIHFLVIWHLDVV